MKPSGAKRPLTGWHVFAGVFLFFAVVISVNALMATLAVRTFSGEDVKKSYLQGLNYNQTLAQQEKDHALGWRVTAQATAHGLLTLTITDRAGTPLTDVRVKGRLRHPATTRRDIPLDAATNGKGDITVPVPRLTPGAWTLDVTLKRTVGDHATVQQKLWVE
jgi:nitrogen fixation protein FixH